MISLYGGVHMDDTRGFYLNDEQRIHLNLSDKSWSVIDHDLMYFQERFKLTTFLNLVIAHSARDAEASIQVRLETYRDDLRSVIGNSASYEKAVDALLDKEQRRLKNGIRKTKGTAFKLRLNNENAVFLTSSPEKIHYDGDVSSYVKNIIEEYSEKPIVHRERIICKDIVDTVSLCVDAGRKCLLESGSTTLVTTPYAIVSSKEDTFNYLVGLADDGSITTNRVSRINRIKPYGRRVLSQAEKKSIDKSINAAGPQFVRDGSEEFKVKMTKNGVRQYRMIYYNKPQHIRIEHGDTYVFSCSRRQFTTFFFRFGADAVVLEPESIRKQFESKYKKAFDVYKNTAMIQKGDGRKTTK
jgi:hypothetical protein